MSTRKEELMVQGQAHFQEAISMALITPGADVGNALVGIAREMVEVGVVPTEVLDWLVAVRNGVFPVEGLKRDEEILRFIEDRIAEVDAMLGNHKEVKSLRSAIYAAEYCIRNGIDPTELLEAAVDRITHRQVHYDDYCFKIEDYVRIARILQRAGLDPAAALSSAEETLEAAREHYERIWDRAYKVLGVGYATCGLTEKSLDMVDLIVERHRDVPSGARNLVEDIAHEHVAFGSYEAAVSAAKKLGLYFLTAEMLAYKAVDEAKRGLDALPTIEETLELVRGREYEDIYEKTHPLLALATKLCGRNRRAGNLFKVIDGEILRMDILYQADVSFKLAEALDQAGVSVLAERTYRRGFDRADRFRIEVPDYESLWGMSWGMYQRGIDILIEEGRFKLAKEYIDKYPDDGWGKSMFLASLAREEIKSAQS